MAPQIERVGRSVQIVETERRFVSVVDRQSVLCAWLYGYVSRRAGAGYGRRTRDGDRVVERVGKRIDTRKTIAAAEDGIENLTVVGKGHNSRLTADAHRFANISSLWIDGDDRVAGDLGRRAVDAGIQLTTKGVIQNAVRVEGDNFVKSEG